MPTPPVDTSTVEASESAPASEPEADPEVDPDLEEENVERQIILPAGRYLAKLTNMTFSPMGADGANTDYRTRLSFVITHTEKGVKLHDAFDGIPEDAAVALDFREFDMTNPIDNFDKRTGRQFLGDLFGRPILGGDGKPTGKVAGGFLAWNFDIRARELRCGDAIRPGGGDCVVLITWAAAKMRPGANNVSPERNYINGVYAIPSAEQANAFVKGFGMTAAQAEKQAKNAAAAASTPGQADQISAAIQRRSGVVKVKPVAPATK